MLRVKVMCKREKVDVSLRGFTLIELLTGVVVLGVSVLVAFHAFNIISLHRAMAHNLTVASTLAEDKLEELKNDPYADLITGFTDDLDASGNPGAGIFDLSWTVSAGTVSGTKEITVRTSWPESDTGGGHIVSEGGPASAPASVALERDIILWTIRGQ